MNKKLKKKKKGRLGGSAVKCLPSAQGVILESWDQVPHRAPCMEPASPSAYVSASLCVSFMNKYIKSFKRKRKEGTPGGSLGGAAVWRLPLAQGAILEIRDRIPRRAPGAWSLLLPLPVSLPLSLSLWCDYHK